jgi:hypothetical protein
MWGLPEGRGRGSVTERFDPDWRRWRDEVDTLVYEQLSIEQIEAAREALIEWYRRSRQPDIPLYATPDGDFLTPSRLVEELSSRTELGQSYVEIFLAGVLTDPGELRERTPAERVEFVLALLRQERGEPWPFL